jgi:uncharacterized membrane protein YfhO
MNMTEVKSTPLPDGADENATVLPDAADKPAADPAPTGGRIARLWHDKWYLVLCFSVPAVLMFLIYVAHRVYPFGEESVLVLDLNGQYVYYFEALRKLLHGEGSFLYSFGRSLGGEFMGIFAYYLASPFSFIVALFPKKYITEALLVMFLLKTGLCGLNFGIYLGATRRRNPVAVILFSTMYALSAYAVVQQHNTMWIDNVLFLPLILLGEEALIRRGKYRLFVVTLSLAVLSNFYIGYMTCIFVAVYFFYSYFSQTPEERNPLGLKHHFPRTLVRMGVYSLIAVCIAAVIILPAYYSLTFGKTTFSNPNYTFTQKFDFLDAISKMYFGSYDTVRPEGLPFLYTGMLTFLLLPLYFLAPHIRVREKIAAGLLVTFFFISFNGSTIDLIWHGFQRPNWLNYRYSFMLCFVFLVMAYKAFEEIRRIGYRSIILSVTLIAGLLLILQRMDLSNLPDLVAVWPSLAFLGVYLLLMRACTDGRGDIRETGALILALAVSLEMFCAGLVNVVYLGADVVYSSRTSYRSFIDRLQPIVDELKGQDDSFYRMEKTIHRKTNDNLALGMRGLSNSTSTLNASVIEFLRLAGLSSKSHWTKYFGSTPIVDSLLGIRYVITENSANPSPLYVPYYADTDRSLTAYYNPYALSVAFGVSTDLEEYDFGTKEVISPFVRLNQLVTKMLGESRTRKLFRMAKTDNIDYTYCDVSMVVGHNKYTPSEDGKKAKITYTLTAESAEVLYCYFPSDYPREMSITVNGRAVGSFFANETFAIRSLGTFAPGSEIKIVLTLEDKELYLAASEPFFYYLDEAVFRDVMEKLGDSVFEIEEFTEDSFRGAISVAEGDELIFTSIPYDEGWVITVDGESVQPVRVCGALLAFETTPGTHTLVMEYRPSCVRNGLALTALGLGLFAVSICVGSIRARRKKKPADGEADGEAPENGEAAEPPADERGSEAEEERKATEDTTQTEDTTKSEEKEDTP